MNRTSEIFCLSEKSEKEDLGGGVSRTILGYDGRIMMVKIGFEAGATGEPHQHFHSQTTYILSGKFEFSVGGENKAVGTGDGLYIPPDTIHGVVCLEAGELIDAFSPAREDFL